MCFDPNKDHHQACLYKNF